MTIEQMSNKEIRTYAHHVCILCNTPGELLYHQLKDHQGEFSQGWNFRRCPNTQCGLVWLDPIPLEADLIKAYQNYYTHKDFRYVPSTWLLEKFRFLKWATYSAIRKAYLAHRYGYGREHICRWKTMLGHLAYLNPKVRADIDLNVMYLPSRPGGRLLDIGFGNAYLLSTMQALKWKVEGIEIDPTAVARARCRGLRVYLGTVTAQHYPDNSFDAVTLNHAIEHVSDPLRLLKECHRILKPGGHFVIATPNSGASGHKYFKASWFSLDPPRHLTIFSSASLCSLVEQSGFENIEMITDKLRLTREVFLSSSLLKHSKEGIPGRRPSVTIRILALAWLLSQWCILRVNPDAGEELIMIAKK